MRTTILFSTLAFTALVNAQERIEGLAGMNAPARTAVQPVEKPSAEAAVSATASYNNALDRLAAGDAQGAIADLEQVLLVQPRDAYALLGRAEAYTAAGEPERATSDLWSALSIQPRGPVAERALLRLGQNAMDEGDPRTAEILFDRYVNIAPYDARAWCHRGIARTALRDNDRALDDMNKAIALDPNLDIAHVNKAIILLRLGFRQEGCASLQQAHDLGDLSTEELLLIHCDR